MRSVKKESEPYAQQTFRYGFMMLVPKRMSVEAVPVYFHGIPGGAGELNLFGSMISDHTSHFVIAQRDFPKRNRSPERFLLIADALREKHRDRPLRLIGFSMGAAAALRTAPFLGSQVEKIDLVSAAAPLDLGDYLRQMAGAAIFRCARDYPSAFGFLLRGQSLLARFSPDTLFSALFSNAQGADADLCNNPCFRKQITSQVTDCLIKQRDVYKSEILAYVGNWKKTLSQISQPVTIFHGEADNWSPLEMARDLASNLQNCQRLEIVDGCSHYSTLKVFFESI